MLSTSRNACLEERHILDVAFVANEVVNSKERKGTAGILC